MMPKIIHNLKAQLMAEARRQIEANGYALTTIRSVAGGCGIAVGTVYNYFTSKDRLIAAYVLEDWQRFISEAEKETAAAPTMKEKLFSIHRGLGDFIADHQSLFTDKDAKNTYAAFLNEKHAQLRAQIAGLICPENSGDFLFEYMAESVITWTLAGVDFETLYGVLKKLV